MSQSQVPATLNDLLQASVAKHGELPALAFKDGFRTRRWTYRELGDAVEVAASRLAAHGVSSGSRVLLWADNSPYWVIAMFGLLRLGAVAVPLDVRSEPGFVARISEQVRPVLAVLSRRLMRNWNNELRAVEIESLPASDGPDYVAPAAKVASDDLAEIVFTSGTTGSPKGVLLTHGNIAANVASINAIIPSSTDDRVVSFLPLSHMLEQTAGMFLPLSSGASIYYPQSRQSRHLAEALSAQRPTMLLLVPQALDLFMAQVERQARESKIGAVFPSLLRVSTSLPLSLRRKLFRRVQKRLGGNVRYIVSGGARLDPALLREWELLGFPVVEGYGATEAAPVIACTAIPGRRPAWVGPPLPGVEVRLGEDGEVLVRGENVTPGYFENDEATAAAFTDGWYRTGDIGALRDDGYLRILGRKKDVIVLPDGQNVYPDDVEGVLSRVPDVREATVVGYSTDGNHEVWAVVVMQPESAMSAQDVVQQANLQLAPHQRIRGVEVWPGDELPKTLSLKVKKPQVLEWLESAATREAVEPGPQEAEQRDLLLELVREITGDRSKQVSDSSTLEFDLGLDSLGVVSLLSAIESEMGAYIDESTIDASTTVADLRLHIEQAAQAARPSFPSWPLSAPASAVRRVVGPLILKPMSLVTPLRVEGLEYLETASRPLLLASNHSSHLDTPVILKALPGELRRKLVVAAAADYFFRNRLVATPVGLLLNAFPFSRTDAVRPTLEHCGNLMDRGWSILLYPEGTRSLTGELQPFKSGVGLLGVELEAPVVPVRVRGTFQSLPKGRSRPRRSEVTVRFGKPLHFPRDCEYETATTEIERAVAEL